MILALELSPALVYVYDLGHAHGRETFLNLEYFVESLSKAIRPFPNRAICAWTNSGQSIERGWLSQIGFATKKCDERMSYHSIGRPEWDKFYANIAVLIEEIKAKEEARIKAEWAEFRAHEEKDGRKRDEIRVGDVVHYTPDTSPDNKIRIMTDLSISNQSACYCITEILPSGRVVFVGYDRANKRTGYTGAFRNYDYDDGGFIMNRCVRPKWAWDLKIKVY